MISIGLPALVLMGAGCTVGPHYQPPASSMPRSYSTAGKADAIVSDTSVNLAEWWTVFNDSQLTALIQSAAVTNLDVRLATARVREARAQRGITESALGPQVGTGASYARTRTSGKSPTGEALSTFQRPLENNLFDASLDMTWELDLFGGNRRAVEAADAQLGAEVESRHDVLITVFAEIGLSYLDLRGAQRQLAVARQNLRLQEDTLSLAQDRLKSGLATELDASRARAEVAATRAQIPPLEEARQRALHRLAVLVDENPGELDALLGAPASIPMAPPRVPLGLPSELLRQRPDIRVAERQLAASTARIGVATADLFPKFHLTGTAGLQSIEAGDFASAGSRFWSIGPSIQWPIFTSGRIRQNIRVQDARQEQAAIVYEKTVLNSLEQAQNALVAFGQEQERHQALLDATAASQRSFALAEDRYRAGLVGFLDVLEAQRNVLQNQDALAQSDRLLSQDLIRLFKALGGGWSAPQLASR
jgi:NodT family efflux transporter outer membrane factor (OMF) lipoprotein